MKQILLKPGKEEFVKRFHPWIFSGALAIPSHQKLDDGDLVEVLDRKKNVVAVGHFHHGSIAVRVLAFQAENLDNQDFWNKKIAAAKHVREAAHLIGNPATDCFRLIHGEGDGLSGLVVDIYGKTAVVQCHSIGMHRQKSKIVAALQANFGKTLSAIYDKSAESLPANYAAGIENGFLMGKSEGQIVSENGIKFRIDFEGGQKTGFFLDQRDNRQLLQKFAAGKTVLNAFCYTGGFSAYALKAGAKSVDSVDVSQKAIDLCGENMELNQAFSGAHQAFCADVPQFLKNSDKKYDVAIIDPPAFAKSLEKRHNAVQGYKRLNVAALQAMQSGGIMFTFSCSQVVDKALFYNTIVAAAIEAGQQVRVLHHLTQGADHPVNIFHPEGSYLKGLVLYIE